MMTTDRPLAFTPDDRLEPQAISAEIALLGCILLQPEILDDIEAIPAAAFYARAHGVILEAMRRLWRDSTPPDLITLDSELSRANELEAVGGRKAIADLMDAAPVSSHGWEHYAALIREKHLARQLIRAGRHMGQLAHKEETPIEERIDQAQQMVYDLSEGSVQEPHAIHVSDVLTRIMERLDSGRPQGTKGSSFYDLNSLTGGIFPGHLMVCAASTGTGKTHFGLAQALDYADRFPVLFISCEMTEEEITDRALALLSGVDSDRISNSILTPQEMDKLARGMAVLSTMRLHIYSRANPSPAQIRAEIRRVARVEKETPKLVVLDYLQLLRGNRQNRVDDLDQITMACKEMAMEFGLTFLALAQISRDFKGRANKRPMVQDIRDCGAIENHSNRIYLLYRDEIHNPETPDHGIIEINVAKNRGGKEGQIRMLFDPARSWFGDIKGATYGSH
jgi:replicative DNA helicase